MEPLLIVDLQKAFPPPRRFIERVRRYSRRFTCRIFTRFVNPSGSLFRTKLKQRSCLPGSEDLELLIAPEKGDLVLNKQGYGLPPSAIKRIRRLGVKRVTVCGLDTDACVLGVMFSLFDAGIECRVKQGLCWSSTGLHRQGMAIIEAQFPEPKRRRTKRKSRRRRKSSAR
jgi:nicotinamidase-related amidase